MLVVIFGAGASYDSNLDLPVGADLMLLRAANVDGHITVVTRPPLAPQLFAMDRDVHQEASVAFERAAPALQDAREDVEVGLSIEAALQRLQDESDSDPDVRARLLSLRYYLQRVLTRTPRAWDAAANGQTSYVSLLAQLGRWSRAVNEQLCLITFNYDDMLERAIARVFSHTITSFDDYLSHDRFRLYKPHGSITWAYELPWHETVVDVLQDERRHDVDRNKIIDTDPELEGLPLEWRRPTDPPLADVYGDPSRLGPRSRAYVPALAIPVEKKPGLILPLGHEESMRRDLNQASAVLTIGWRAREQHVIDLLTEELPARRPLHVVAEDKDAATETASNLWATGKFNRHAEHTAGFAQFARPAPSVQPSDPLQRLRAVNTVGPVLRQEIPMSGVHPDKENEFHESWDPNTVPGPYAPFEVPRVRDA